MSLSGVQTSKHSLEQHNKLTCGGVDGVDGVVDIDGVVDVDGVDCSRVCVVAWSDLAGGQWDVRCDPTWLWGHNKLPAILSGSKQLVLQLRLCSLYSDLCWEV